MGAETITPAQLAEWQRLAEAEDWDAEAEWEEAQRGLVLLLAEVARLQRLTAWQNCPTHGRSDASRQWGCPDCVRELRQDLARVTAERDEARRDRDSLLRLCADAMAQAVSRAEAERGEGE